MSQKSSDEISDKEMPKTFSLQEIKERYSKGLQSVVNERQPNWRADNSDLSNTSVSQNHKVLVEGLPAGVYICDLLKKYRTSYFDSIYQCLGYIKQNGFHCTLEDWSYFEEGYAVPSEDELREISTIIGFPTNEMLQLRRAQLEQLKYKITDQSIFTIKQEVLRWEHEVCGIIARSKLFFSKGLPIHPQVRDTLIFSSGTIDHFRHNRRSETQCVTLEVLWNHWEREFWSRPKTESIDPEVSKAEANRDLFPIAISYTISERGTVDITQIIDDHLLVHTVKGNKPYQHWCENIPLQFAPQDIHQQAIPHTLTSMIERLKRGVLGWDLSNINPDKSKYFKQFSPEERTQFKHILQLNSEHVLYIMDSEEKTFQSGPDVEILFHPKVYSHWSKDKSFFIGDYEIHPLWVKISGDYILASNRPLPVEWWLHYIDTEWNQKEEYE